jgi:hypothetical protein
MTVTLIGYTLNGVQAEHKMAADIFSRRLYIDRKRLIQRKDKREHLTEYYRFWVRICS